MQTDMSLNEMCGDEVVIDIRNRGVLRYRYPGSIAVGADKAGEYIRDKRLENTTIIIICDYGYQSNKLVLQLREAGYDNCFSLSGGLSGVVKQRKDFLSAEVRDVTRYDEERYSRSFGIDGYSIEMLQVLINTKVTVVGVGGLGIPIINTLLSMGIRNYQIYESDTIDLSNLPRQWAYREKDLGKPKSKVIRNWIKDRDHRATVTCFDDLSEASDLGSISETDAIIDCSDSYNVKRFSSEIAKEFGIPFSYGAVTGTQGYAALFVPGSFWLDDIFPQDPPSSLSPACSVTGVSPMAPTLVGIAQANLLIKGIAESRSTSEIFEIDSKSMQFNKIHLK